MPDRSAEIDACVARDRDRRMRSEICNRVSASFEFECRRHSVSKLELLAERCPRMTVNVYEARRHDEAACVDRRRTLHRLYRYRGYAALGNADVSNGVEPRLRVDDTPADEYDIVLGGVARRKRRITAGQDTAANGQQNDRVSQNRSPSLDWALARSTFLSILPTGVNGISSMTWITLGTL